MTIKEILEDSLNKLEQKKIQDSLLKTKIIIANVLKVDKEYLLTHEDDELEKKAVNIIKKDICKLLKGNPVQYIINNQHFFGLSLFVNKDVLMLNFLIQPHSII